VNAGLPGSGASEMPAATLALLVEEVVERTVAVASLPAPTGEEERRAELVAGWWREDGFEVERDAAGNCWAVARPGAGPALVLAAHLDTVFPRQVEHRVERRPGLLAGPSVGDDSVALAALGAVGRLLGSAGSLPVLLLATVGEEGTGNLAGARHALAEPPCEIAAFVAVEGNYLGRIATVGVGSRRLQVAVSGPGGHAWEQSQAPSALHEAARLVHELSGLPTEAGVTSCNIGRFAGGEAINARSRLASFDLDVRGADEPALSGLWRAVEEVLGGPLAPGLSLETVDLGRRPAGRLDPAHPLLAAAHAALAAHGIAGRETAASTDANAAHAAGVPALALGVTRGSGEHTPEEWIETGPIGEGLLVLVDTVLRYEAARATAGEEVSGALGS